jgi:NTE family protein
MPQTESHRADGVFEGGGVKGIAFAGAVAAAEEEAGVREWVNLAGTSAGAIVAALLAVGYDSAGLRKILADAQYRRFADYGFGGRIIGGGLNALRSRSLAPGRYFKDWLGERLAESSLAKELGEKDLRFRHLQRADLPARQEVPEISDLQYERAKYRLHVIASDVTAGRMIVLPDQIDQYEDEQGKMFVKDDLRVTDAVRMSMSYPYLYEPVRLFRDRHPYYVVDGGLLSNFPIWLFDGPNPKRPTYGFRLHGGATPEEPLPYRTISRPLWPLPLIKAMFFSAMEAWDREHLGGAAYARTISIPTHDVKTTDFNLSADKAEELYRWGEKAARGFFLSPKLREYQNSFGERLAVATPS